MNRRNFIQLAAILGAGSLLPIPSWAMNYMEEDFSEVNPSFSTQFMLLKIQKLILNSGLYQPELERLMVTDLNSSEAGNAFAMGRFSLVSQDELNSFIQKSYQEFKKNPGNLMARRMLAYALGSLAYSKIRLSFSNPETMAYLTDPEKSADLDYLILRNFYIRKDIPELKNQDLIVDLLNTMTTRTYVRYHTLKCAESMPMEWLDHTVAYRERQLEHYKEIAARFSDQQVIVPKAVFDPLDPALHSISPGLNSQKVNREMLGELVAVPTMHSAVGKSILGGVKLILDYQLEG
jgi:hypothetical protein